MVGLGYIGLPTALLLASKGVRVAGLDVKADVVDLLNGGAIHIFEPGLQQHLENALREQQFTASLEPRQSDAFIIAVPTPIDSDKQPDISCIRAAARSIAPVLERGNLIVLESTSPVGTTEEMAGWLAEDRPDLIFPLNGETDVDVNIAYCPERVLPGKVIEELVSNDRIIGGLTSNCSRKAKEMYRIFVRGKLLETNARTAEMAKLTENSFRDVNIAFANELSIICDEVGINPFELVNLANHHPRVNILQPGPGVGGHCIAVDPWFIVSKTPEKARMIRTAREINDSKPLWVLNKLDSLVADFLDANPTKNRSDVVITCLGLAFKADIDDLRESPALSIARTVSHKHPGRTLVVEPFISALPEGFRAGSDLSPLDEALNQADVVLLLVDHSQFKTIDPSRLQSKVIIDTRGILK